MTTQKEDKSKEIADEIKSKDNDMILVNRSSVIDKDKCAEILESLLFYESFMEFNFCTSSMLESNIVGYVDGEFVTSEEQIKFHNGKGEAFFTVLSMIDNGVFDIEKDEISNECKNNCYL
jgi:hypothetical protein